MPGVYMILNTMNGKVYVGGTTMPPQKRWGDHKSALKNNRHFNPHLQRSWNKYGDDAFEFLILQETAAEDVWDSEQAWLDFFLDVGKGIYNYSPVAISPMLGRTHSEETRKKIGDTFRGKPLSKEHREKIRDSNKGKHTSNGRKLSEEHKQKIGDAFRGRKLSREHREKLKKPKSAEHILKLSKPYPALYNKNTSEIIPSGINGSKLCREKGWNNSNFSQLVNSKQHSMKGWVLMSRVHPVWQI